MSRTTVTAPRRRGDRTAVVPDRRQPQMPDEVAEFARAMEQYKQRSGRMFPTWSEVLEVLRGLGYEREGLGQAGAPDGLGPGVAIVAEGPQAGRIAQLLTACGGSGPPSTARRPVYRFHTPRARDEALNTARRAFGWTCVEPL